MNFEVNGNTYFVGIAEEKGWEVFVSTATGARAIPVYEDAADSDLTIVVADERKRRIVN